MVTSASQNLIVYIHGFLFPKCASLTVQKKENQLVFISVVDSKSSNWLQNPQKDQLSGSTLPVSWKYQSKRFVISSRTIFRSSQSILKTFGNLHFAFFFGISYQPRVTQMFENMGLYRKVNKCFIFTQLPKLLSAHNKIFTTFICFFLKKITFPAVKKQLYLEYCMYI